ncbi:MAG: hypothetical protein GX303_08235 [Clostridiales bacterium]|nr:hypothetical protein [Clostridiales bacterium]
MLKKMRLYVAVSLMVQSVTLALLFLILWARKKSISRAILALSAAQGAASLFLFWLHLRDPETEIYDNRDLDYDFFDDDDFEIDESILSASLRRDEEDKSSVITEIPRDEDASEADFQ